MQEDISDQKQLLVKNELQIRAKQTPEKSLKDKGRARQGVKSRKGRRQQVGRRWELKKNAQEMLLVRRCPCKIFVFSLLTETSLLQQK